MEDPLSVQTIGPSEEVNIFLESMQSENIFARTFRAGRFVRSRIAEDERQQAATQKRKKRLLSKASISIPQNMQFVDIDFESQRLVERLYAAGSDPSAPTLFSVGRDHVLESSHGCGNTAQSDRQDFPLCAGLLGAKLGEQWIGLLKPDALAADMKAMGFSSVEDIPMENLNTQFFKVRGTG